MTDRTEEKNSTITGEKSARRQSDVPATEKRTPDEPLDSATTGEMIDRVEGEIEEMVAREQRRDQNYRSGGDDHDPEIDETIDQNGPKQIEIEDR